MKIKQIIYLLSLFLFAVNAYSGVMPSQSRIIYHAADKEKSLMLANTNNYPVVVQNWIDNGEGSPDTKNIPFISIPPVFQLQPSDVKGVRVIYNMAELPKDRETIFWFNIYEIPPEKKNINPDNSLLITMNTQIKLFFRPEGITTKPEAAIKNLACHINDEFGLECDNPTAIHISIVGMNMMTVDGDTLEAQDQDLLFPPFSQKKIYFNMNKKTIKNLTIKYINDGGEYLDYTSTMID